MEFEFETELLELESFELAEELEFREWELNRNIREAYEDSLYSQYDDIDSLYW
jgi:hypothetical protein